MIRSTTSTLKFCNTGKLEQLHQFIDEYRRVVSDFIDFLWNEDRIPVLIPKEITSQVDTWLSARMLQCAGKQASGVVRGTRKKQEQRKYVVSKLTEEGKTRKARKLQTIIDKTTISKPNIDSVCPELDSRFVTMDLDNHTSFDGWLRLGSIGDKIKINVPFKKSKHFNKLLNKGVLKLGIRLSKKQVTFMFDLPEVEKRENGEVVGIDIGQTTTISCSDGFTSMKCNHGHDLASITEKLCRKNKGSNGFHRTQSHRKNYIHWTINQLNLSEVKECRVENIKNIRRGRRTNRRLSHWTYTDIFSKLESRCEELGVQVTHISPTYTSRRCSECGWTRSSNRKGKEFKCGQCGFTLDADLNASKNIAANLEQISYKKRHLYNIRTGFWWNVSGEKPVVSLVQ